MRLRQHDAPISLTIQHSLNARVDGILCCLSRNRISQLRLSQHCVVHEICFQHVAFVCLHMVGRSLGCGSPHARLLSPKRSSLCLDLLCVFICGNGHQLSLAAWSTLTGLRRTTWFLRKGRSHVENRLAINLEMLRQHFAPMETAAHPRFLFRLRTFGMISVTLTSSASLWTGVVKTFRCTPLHSTRLNAQ